MQADIKSHLGAFHLQLFNQVLKGIFQMRYCVQSRIASFNCFIVIQSGNYQREESVNAINNKMLAT